MIKLRQLIRSMPSVLSAYHSWIHRFLSFSNEQITMNEAFYFHMFKIVLIQPVDDCVSLFTQLSVIFSEYPE